MLLLIKSPTSFLIPLFCPPHFLDNGDGDSNNYTAEILIGVATTLASALILGLVKKCCFSGDS